MSKLLEGKRALVLGVANKWSLAYAIAQSFVREGASLILTYQGDRQRLTVEELGADLSPIKLIDLVVSFGNPDQAGLWRDGLLIIMNATSLPRVSAERAGTLIGLMFVAARARHSTAEGGVANGRSAGNRS